ncbi:hypothetical protein M434DRAFT_38075 [Hypoxylon sp. CO27-5]|nr:hypothetical protein M434DRAFT_38075 [Hypoxylon sp. CO27-5]
MEKKDSTLPRIKGQSGACLKVYAGGKTKTSQLIIGLVRWLALGIGKPLLLRYTAAFLPSEFDAQATSLVPEGFPFFDQFLITLSDSTRMANTWDCHSQWTSQFVPYNVITEFVAN